MGYYKPCSPSIRPGQRFGANPGWGPNPAGGHNGNDELTPVGTPVHAAGDGVVIFAGQFDSTYADNFGWNLNYGGNMVVLNLDGAAGPYVEYGHLEEIFVKEGDRVRGGDVICTSGATDGNTGVITGPHLHVGCLPPNFNLNTNTYGRVNPDIYLTEYWDGGTVAAQGEVTPTEEDEEMYVIARDSASANPDAVYIGNGIHRRHIPDPPTLDAVQKMAGWGVLKVFKNGEVQDLPTAALGDDVASATTSQMFNTIIHRQGAGANIGPETSLGALVAWHDHGSIALGDQIAAAAAKDGVSVEDLTKALSNALANGLVKVDVTVAGQVQ